MFLLCPDAFCPMQVSSWWPMQDVNPITMMYDNLYFDGELWELWLLSHE